MTVFAADTQASTAHGLHEVGDYMGLSVDQRYQIVSRHFPDWLSSEPINFPPHHPTYGWACRVPDCDGALALTGTQQMCVEHARAWTRVKNSVDPEEFLASAQPSRSKSYGWALVRRTPCEVINCPRESTGGRFCDSHSNSHIRAARRGISEAQWAGGLRPWPPLNPCAITLCVHDAPSSVRFGPVSQWLCNAHYAQARNWLKSIAGQPVTDTWDRYMKYPYLKSSVSTPSARGMLSLATLGRGLGQEIRYALHRHTNIARRTQWRPASLQIVVDTLAAAGVDSLNDPAVAALAADRTDTDDAERRVWVFLPAAARSLSVSPQTAKAAGWFDPILVGAAPFPGVQSHQNRRKPWDLTAVSQRWLRDLLWEHLEDSALRPAGKRTGGAAIHDRIVGIALLSHILHQNRTDHGEHPELIGGDDAVALKQTLDLWLLEQIPLPIVSAHTRNRTLTSTTRKVYASNIRTVLQRARELGRTVGDMDAFILSLPDYPPQTATPRPRPLSYGDFQLMVSPESLRALDALDPDNVGFSDLWLTQAFQGGRISETAGLRLGCLGLVGAAQPYIWRDISKIGVVDYGMPCHLPVYERLLRRQEHVRTKLRFRYRDDVAPLDAPARAKVEATWEREMPLFPGVKSNPDLKLEVSTSWFRTVWQGWFEQLGLSSITTHQTRATLATSLLNNGAPPALVRQLLGHFSERALVHYANYNNDTMVRQLQKVWAASPGMNKPGTILLRPTDPEVVGSPSAGARIDLTVVPVEHGLCRYGPVVGGAHCPYGKNCTTDPKGTCENFVLTGADLSYWERKRDAAYHFAEGAPNDQARDYILDQWTPWEPALTGLRDALDELGLLEAAEALDLRTPVHDYFDPLFATGWPTTLLESPRRQGNPTEEAESIDNR